MGAKHVPTPGHSLARSEVVLNPPSCRRSPEGWMGSSNHRPIKLTVVVDEKGGRIFHRGWPIECEAVIPRIGFSITRRGVAIVRQFEQMGVIVLNQSLSIEQSRTNS